MFIIFFLSDTIFQHNLHLVSFNVSVYLAGAKPTLEMTIDYNKQDQLYKHNDVVNSLAVPLLIVFVRRVVKVLHY